MISFSIILYSLAESAQHGESETRAELLMQSFTLENGQNLETR